ncbi:hypothetical protein JSO19_01075 [Leucobacter sp. UCMA 4100]|uniref:MaoC/PaaZ C-terminal domain-containing protein n=1 Tax=Leucobacter TaxID=55968 RepID=UPI001C249B51|nr:MULTISPECIES: MaoC/PaaZ C-terminal domain-containing protein [Leucobacter]MDA3145969.1 hypothetical protein [Leucobacter sp. UCMA 4100]
MTLATIAQHVGETFFTSPWMTIDEQHLAQFAYSTYLDPDHADLTASKNNPLGSTLVDGFLLTSMLTMFHFNNSPVREPGIYGFNYGMDRVRFTHPVFVGEELRCVATLEKVDERPDGRVLVTTNNVIELKHTDKPAMVATWVTLFATLDGTSEA